MIESRDKMLRFLKRRGKATISELAHELGLTTVTIRHHLEVLREMGLLEKPRAKPRSGPGRPELVYRLTENADRHLPRNYTQLTQALVDVLSTTRERSSLADLFLRAGLEAGRNADLDEQVTREQYVENVCRWLEARGYLQTSELQQDVLSLRFNHCPYLEIAREHKVICLFDQALLGLLFDAPVKLSRRIAMGDDDCRLLILLQRSN